MLLETIFPKTWPIKEAQPCVKRYEQRDGGGPCKQQHGFLDELG